MDSGNFTQLLSRLDALTAKIGATATHIGQTTPRQQYIQGYTEITVASVLFFSFLIGLFFTITRWEDINDAEPAIVFVLIGLFISIVASILLGIEAIQYLLNPQYFALQDMFNLIPK